MEEQKRAGLPAEVSTKAGHRSRLRQRFLEAGLDGFLDYEVVELLLTLGTPQKDCKQMAKQAIAKFGNLQNTLDASAEELQQIKEIGPANILGLKLFQQVSKRRAKEKVFKKTPLTSPEIVVNYLKEKLGQEKRENFVILPLDTRNYLIEDKNISIGTLNASLVHPREVFREAIQSSASQVIIAHNHPSGDPEPSESDLEITKRLTEAGKILGIEIIDHIIITKSSFFSFKDKALI